MAEATKRTTPRKTKEQREAEKVRAELEALTITFHDGIVLRLAEVNGRDEFWLRQASAGRFETPLQAMNLLEVGSQEAAGALYWLARLKARNLSPDDYEYVDALSEMTTLRVADMQAGAGDPT